VLKKYTPFLFIALLGATILPYNLLHHHAEDEHALAILKHTVNSQHHCDLDDYFCETTNQHACEHPHHLANTLEKCFSCDFHFIKHYDASVLCDVGVPHFCFNFSLPHQINIPLSAFKLISNKGPPTII
jgi:hypothetical protein